MIKMFVHIEDRLNILDVQPASFAGIEVNDSTTNLIVASKILKGEFKVLQNKVVIISKLIKTYIDRINFEYSYVIEELLCVTYKERFSAEIIASLLNVLKKNVSTITGNQYMSLQQYENISNGQRIY